MFAFGKIYEQKYGLNIYSSLEQNFNRYGADCRPDAGAVPCDLVNFHHVTSTDDLYSRIEALFNKVFKNRNSCIRKKLFLKVFSKCTPIYRSKWESWLGRFHESLFCPMDECALGLSYCAENAECFDLKHGYDCSCKEHYFGDGFTWCEPLNYCGENLCPAFAECVSLNPGYTCECREGFEAQISEYEPLKCIPIDPCLKNNGGCSKNAKCSSNTFGYDVNYSCKCNQGFFGNGFQSFPT